jgi:HD-GYP domain-containing protein (c-di-GMP phosphodiesterase class II)
MPRERLVSTVLAAGFVAACAATFALIPGDAAADPLTIAALVVLYAAVSSVSFEIGNGYAVPDFLVFVPMLFIVPLPLVAPMVAAAFMLSRLPDLVRGRIHADRVLSCLPDAWFALGPVAVLGALAPNEAPTLGSTGVYALAFGAYGLVNIGGAVLTERLAGHASVRDTFWSALWSLRIDAVLAPLGLMVAIQAHGHPRAIAAIVPLVWLLHVFSQERTERYAASLELSQAYRGTVMLLSDVVEAEDNYTADHCRSVVELVTEVAQEMEVPPADMQELEFAALLHDVGKIAIPKEILNKPAKLTDEEFELIKTHTIEGQVLLDRVGGLLGRVGTIVRSCHERWDGKGYPDGLAGEQIPFAARLVFACDAYNAMTTDRPYRKAMSRDAALEEMRTNSGTQFYPAAVEALDRVMLAKPEYPYLAHVTASDAVAAALAVGRPGSAGFGASAVAG